MQSTNALNEAESWARGSGKFLLPYVPDALIVCDFQGAVSYMSEQAERLLGLDARLVIGTPVGSLVTLELPGGGLLDSGILEELHQRQGVSSFFDDCVLVRDEGKRLIVNCEMVAIGPGAVHLLAVLPVRRLSAAERK